MRKLWEVFILILSFYVIVVLAIEIVSDWSETTINILEQIDFFICIIFLADWIYFFVKAEKKMDYFKSRFFDLISSIPFAQVLRPLRIFRAIRIIRALRIIRGLKGVFPLFRYIAGSKRRSALSIYLSCTGIIYFYCSLGLMNFEKDVNEGINGMQDAFWMAFTTLATVGYGDIYPITNEGRLMAAFLVITGLGLFSLVTAEFATLFINYLNEEKAENSIQK